MIDRRMLLAAGAALIPLAVMGGAPIATRRLNRHISTEEAFATREWLARGNTLSVARRDSREAEFLHCLDAIPCLQNDVPTIDQRLRDMDENGISMHLLGLVSHGAESIEPALTTSMARQINDQMAEVILRHPSRFAALATIAPQDPLAAAAEVERAMVDLKLSGVSIIDDIGSLNLGDPRFEPFLAALERNEAPLYLPGARSANAKHPCADHTSTAAIWRCSATAGYHVMRMIVSGVFDRHPGLTIVVGQVDEAMPYWLQRMDKLATKAWATAESGYEPASKLKKLPSAYFREHFFVTTAGLNSHLNLACFIDLIGVERIMFAIKYPFESSRDKVDFLDSAPISEEQKDLIAYRNAERVFKIGNA